MTAIPFRQSRAFIRGREAEQRVAAWLQGRGWYIIPSYDYSGEHGDKAPKIQGAAEGIVLPDLGIARAGQMKWAEVKAKAGPTFTVTTHTYDHGIGYRKWQHYRRVQQETGCHVWLFIVEECTQLLLAESLDKLGDGRLYDDNKMDPGGMVFWPRLVFGSKLLLAAIPGLFDPAVPVAFEVEP
jgi:hypothetical protein